MSILDTEVLKLDKNWLPFAVTTVKQAFLDASAGAVTLLRFHEGFPTPYRLEDWLNIPVEEKELFVAAGGKFHGEIRKIAIPRVVICIDFDQMIRQKQNLKKKKACTIDNLLEHYEYKDAVTGQPLSRENASREHVRPRSKGGKNGWENEVPMDRRLNAQRSNKSYRKLGLKRPKIKPAPLAASPIKKIVNKHGFEEWQLLGIPDA